jgi:hypothetical protein
MGTKLLARSIAAIVVSVVFLGGVNALTGCAYLETQLQRRAPPDTRVRLGWQDRVSVYSQDLDDYRCESRYTLLCQRGGAITLSCTCAQL